MILRSIAWAAIAVCAAASQSLACMGEVLFADDFSDPAVSKQKWKVSAGTDVSFAKGYMQIKDVSGVGVPGIEKEIDLCVDVVTPKVKRPRIGATAEIETKFDELNDTYYVVFGADAVVMAARTTPAGHGEELTRQRTYPGVKSGVGQKNTLRFRLQNALGTVFVNGRKLFEFKLASQARPPRVNLTAWSEDDSDQLWRFSNVKVTRPSPD